MPGRLAKIYYKLMQTQLPNAHKEVSRASPRQHTHSAVIHRQKIASLSSAAVVFVATCSDAAAGNGDATASGGRVPLDGRPPFRRRNTNPFMEGYDPNVVENEIPPPTVDGATVVPAYQTVEPSRAWDGGVPRIPSGEPSAFLAPGQRDPSAPKRAPKNRGGGGGDDSDADSEATEGCDEHPDDEELGEGVVMMSFIFISDY